MGSYLKRQTVEFTTAADGSATVYTEVVNGGIHAVLFTDTDTDAGADFTITTEATGQAILTATNAGNSDQAYYPRVALNLNTDASALTVYEMIGAVEERIKIVVAQGGNAKSGTFDILVA